MTVSAAEYAPPDARRRVSVLIHLDRAAPAHGDVLMSAAMQLFTAADAVDLAIRIRGVPDPVEADADQLAARCAAVCPHPDALPEIVLLADAEEPDHPVVLTVDQTPDVARTARSVILLAALAQQIWQDERPGSEAPATPQDTASPTRPGPSLLLRDPALGGRDQGYGESSLAAKLGRLTSTARGADSPDDTATATDGRPPTA